MGAQQSRSAEPTRGFAPCEGARQASTSAGGGCPVPEESRGGTAIYNVYSERIDGGRAAVDARNNMPNLSQLPSAGQRQLLTTEREVSTIPKGGTEATWVYPSPQMFYNALRRKGKDEGLTDDSEGDMPGVMEHVVHTHNTMNEMTWQRVQNWERLHPESRECKLNRFLGRPDELSPLARLRALINGQRPFDRHDWYVLRDGKEVRYVIDFYFAEERAGYPDAFEVVTRPALDSVESALDRIKMAVYVQCARFGVPCPITGHAGAVGSEGARAQAPAVEQPQGMRSPAH